jgi:uncharacterized membrane protein
MKICGRFEVKKEAGGSPGNMEYEATDMLDGSAVTLLEWTPEASALAGAVAQLDEMGDGLMGAEAFSQGTSLYLAAASNAAATAALRQLRSAGLFRARWPGFDDPDSTPLPPNPITVAAIPAEPPKRSTMRNWVIAAAAILVVVVLGAMALVEKQAAAQHELDQARLNQAEAQRQQQEAQAEQAAKDAQALKDRLSQAEAQRQSDEAQAEAARKEAAVNQQAMEDSLRQATAERQREAEQARKEKEAQQKELDEARQREKDMAEQKRQADLAKKDLEGRLGGTKTSFDDRQTALAGTLSNQYHRIRLIYSCPGEISVAIHFQGLDQNWVTEGWWRLGAFQQKVADPAYSQNATYYFYAKSAESIWQGHDASAINLEVVENPFIHITGAIQGINRRVDRAPRQEFPAAYGEQPMQFPCSK